MTDDRLAACSVIMGLCPVSNYVMLNICNAEEGGELVTMGVRGDSVLCLQ